MSARLVDLTSPEVRACADAGAVLAVPFGATEQHGPHLPLSTDSDVAVALCERLAAARADVLIAPVVSYGSSGEHAGFAGTLSIGAQALELLVVELCRSACETFGRVVLVSAHGGNAVPVTRAAELLRYEGRDVRVFMPRWDGDPHAGRTETSLQLALRPDVVHMDRAVSGDPRPLAELLPLLQSDGLRAITSTGVLGDPSGSNAHDGEMILASVAATLVNDVASWFDAAEPLAPA